MMKINNVQPGMSTFLATVGIAFSLPYTGLVIKYLINPGNIAPTIVSHEGSRVVLYFESEIANRVPYFFLWIGIHFLLSGIILPSLMADIDTDTNALRKEEDIEYEIRKCSIEVSILSHGSDEPCDLYENMKKSVRSAGALYSDDEMVANIKSSYKFRI